MAHCNTIPNQVMNLISRHEFEKLAAKHHSGQKLRSFSRWSQFLAMTIAQITGRRSIRDLTCNLQVQGARLYHLGMRKTSKSTLACVNEQQPYQALQGFILPVAVAVSVSKNCSKSQIQDRQKSVFA